MRKKSSLDDQLYMTYYTVIIYLTKVKPKWVGK